MASAQTRLVSRCHRSPSEQS